MREQGFPGRYLAKKNKAPPQTLSFVILLRDVFRTVKLLVVDVTNPTTKNKILSEMVTNHFPVTILLPKTLNRLKVFKLNDMSPFLHFPCRNRSCKSDPLVSLWPCKLPELSPLFKQGLFPLENSAWVSTAAKKVLQEATSPRASCCFNQKKQSKTFKSSKLHFFTGKNPEQVSDNFEFLISVLETTHSEKQDFRLRLFTSKTSLYVVLNVIGF